MLRKILSVCVVITLLLTVWTGTVSAHQMEQGTREALGHKHTSNLGIEMGLLQKPKPTKLGIDQGKHTPEREVDDFVLRWTGFFS